MRRLSWRRWLKRRKSWLSRKALAVRAQATAPRLSQKEHPGLPGCSLFWFERPDRLRRFPISSASPLELGNLSLWRPRNPCLRSETWGTRVRGTLKTGWPIVDAQQRSGLLFRFRRPDRLRRFPISSASPLELGRLSLWRPRNPCLRSETWGTRVCDARGCCYSARVCGMSVFGFTACSMVTTPSGMPA